MAMVVPAGAEEPAAEFRFQRLDRSYHDLATDLVPLRQGLLTVTLSSPRNELVLRRHLLRLTPSTGGRFGAELEVEIEGAGKVVADLELAGVSSRFVDDVRLPPQRFLLPAEIEVRIAADGVRVTLWRVPTAVAVRIESGLGRQLGAACDGVALLPCAGIEEYLSSVRVPLPPAGETYLLPMSEISEEELEALRRFVGGATAPSAT